MAQTTADKATADKAAKATAGKIEAIRLEYCRAPRPKATIEDVFFCYRLILDRSPDPEGFLSYAKLVEKGISVGELAKIFIECPEFVAKKSTKSTT